MASRVMVPKFWNSLPKNVNLSSSVLHSAIGLPNQSWEIPRDFVVELEEYGVVIRWPMVLGGSLLVVVSTVLGPSWSLWLYSTLGFLEFSPEMKSLSWLSFTSGWTFFFFLVWHAITKSHSFYIFPSWTLIQSSLYCPILSSQQPCEKFRLNNIEWAKIN